MEPQLNPIATEGWLAAGEELTAATRMALEASVLAARSWGRVLWLVAQPLGRLGVIAWPTVRRTLVFVAERAAAQSWDMIALETVVVVLIIVATTVTISVVVL